MKKALLQYLTVIFTCVVVLVLANVQDFVDNADSTQDDAKSLIGTANHPYVGIPISTWKITDMDLNEREVLCNEQQQFCTNQCGNQDQVLSSFCNKATMAWNCKCKNHVPDIPPYGWPAVVAECKGKENACSKGCTYGATKGICLKACSRYYRCNQAGSPPSGLQVEKNDTMPNYSVILEDNVVVSSCPYNRMIGNYCISYIAIVILLICLQYK